MNLRSNTLSSTLRVVAVVAFILAAPAAFSQPSEDTLKTLAIQKDELSRQFDQTLNAVADAQAELNRANAAGDASAIARWQGEVTKRQNLLQSLDDAIVKNEQDTVNALEGIRAQMENYGVGSIKVGEAIELMVSEDSTLNGVYPVRQGGHVLIPGVGRVKVAEMSLEDAEVAIRDAISQTLIKAPTVVVDRPMSGPRMAEQGAVYVAGRFQLPGAKPFNPNLKVSVSAMVTSNRPTEDADLSRVRLFRIVNQRAVIEQINVQEILDGKGLGYDLEVMTGDLIYVPVKQTDRTVYVTGRVGAPGAIQMPVDERLTAYSAILRAGGLARFANANGAYVVREVGGGQKTQIPVNIGKIRRGLASDVVLEGKDIVVVPERFFSF